MRPDGSPAAEEPAPVPAAVVEQEIPIGGDPDQVIRFALAVLPALAERTGGIPPATTYEFRLLSGDRGVLRLNVLYRDPLELRAAFEQIPAAQRVATIFVGAGEPDRTLILHHGLGRLFVRGSPAFVETVRRLWRDPLAPVTARPVVASDDLQLWLARFNTHRYAEHPSAA